MIAIVAISFVAKADPAKKVNLAYENGNLKIEAIHKVKDVTTHYIDLITIKANGKEIKTIKPQKIKCRANEEQTLIQARFKQ